jgi:16S rRNA (uracil1498-N3)-methyltransferase
LEGNLIRFSTEESSHIVSSLRHAAGDGIVATDGAGKLIHAELEKADRERAVARVTAVEERPPPDVAIALYQGMIRPQRMDLVVEKCVELGVASITPVLTERALDRDAGARLGRWNKIALEAMKQSLRVYLPEVRAAVPFSEALWETDGMDRILVAHEGVSARPLDAGDLEMGSGKLGFFVGPEGGFSQTEIRALSERGGLLFGMGEGRLRSETAAIAGVAIIGRFLQ